MIKIIKLNGLNAISIQKDKDDRTFISTNDGIVISMPSLSTIIKYLIINKFMSPKVLEGILEEYYSDNSY